MDGYFRVLICDDDALVRQFLGMFVNSEPDLVLVGEAVDGVHLIEQARALRPDVIVLDLNMPRRSGLDAIADLRTVTPEAALVVLSGSISDTIEQRLRALGVKNYIDKSAPAEQITQLIRAAARARTTASSTYVREPVRSPTM